MTAANLTPAAASTGRRFTVLQSTGRPDKTTNPYLVQLLRALPASVEIKHFSMRTALLSRYDLFHVHWPEYLVRHPRAIGKLAKQACLLLLLLRLRATNVPIVRTLHNARPHEDGGFGERWLLRRLDRMTTRWIRINAADRDGHAEADTILHGHYRDWFAARPVPASVRGRLLYFGLLRPYKGVETLLATFRALTDDAATLRIVGNPVSADMRHVVENACRGDARVSARLEYVDDDVLAREIGEAQLVVLPYREMHNSGALLLALSLSRPVLVPRTEANIAIAKEVGPGWVHLYDGALSADALIDALRRCDDIGITDQPDLSRREWTSLGAQHYDTYRSALRAAAGRG